MNISVFGLGYVGAVTVACLSRDGHHVTGVDQSPAKTATVARGESPIEEPGLAGLLASGVQEGRITASTCAKCAVRATSVSLVSVGTPPGPRGEPDLSFVYRVCEEIGAAIALKREPHVVVLRSTVPPGTLDRCREILERAAGQEVPVAFNPEFLREGSAIDDFDAPPYTIIGTRDAAAERAVRDMYAGVDAPVVVVGPGVAELVKYVANAWHANKVTFANEVGRLAKAFGVDGREVMRVITLDHKLNCSAAYLRPGFAYGGSCLPKDLASLLHFARSHDVPLPLIGAIPESNDLMIELAARAALQSGARRVAVLGLAFKANTDDMRSSPAVPLVKRLLGEGYEVRIFDPFVNHARLVGTNLAFIQENIPHFVRLMCADGRECLQDSELVIVTYPSPAYQALLADARPGTRVLDLAGALPGPPPHLDYHSLA